MGTRQLITVLEHIVAQRFDEKLIREKNGHLARDVLEAWMVEVVDEMFLKLVLGWWKSGKSLERVRKDDCFGCFIFGALTEPTFPSLGLSRSPSTCAQAGGVSSWPWRCSHGSTRRAGREKRGGGACGGSAWEDGNGARAF